VIIPSAVLKREKTGYQMGCKLDHAKFSVVSLGERAKCVCRDFLGNQFSAAKANCSESLGKIYLVV
jgi:hypothetical protein